MGHAHDHGDALASGDVRRRLAIAVGINVAIVIGEAVGGWVTGSLALLADAGHNLLDVGALLVAYLATALAALPPNSRKSFGYYRLEIVAALVNGIVLVLVSLFIVVEAVGRFRDPAPLPALSVLFIALMALGGNLASAAVLLPRRSSLNVRAAVLHLLADALSSVGVIVAAIFVFYGYPVADPVAGLFIAAVIVVSGYTIIRESVDVLLQAVPRGIDVDSIKRAIETVPHVEGVHDLHVWSLTSGRNIASLHVIVPPERLRDCDEIVANVSRKLHDDFAIEHTTVQVESPGHEDVGHVHD